MDELSLFQFGPQEVRELEKDGEPWFVAKDVAEILGYSSTKDMTRLLDGDEKEGQILPTLGGNQEMTLINEAGLYSAILRSTKAEAKAFKRWVTHEVLPSIRRAGRYELERANGDLKDELLDVHRKLSLAQDQQDDLEERLERKGRPLFQFEKAAIDACIKEGWPTAEIAKRLGRGKDSIRRYKKQKEKKEEGHG
ncbi:MAG: Bro-N domain-containing protein, partial [Spirochaetota bacterium]